MAVVLVAGCGEGVTIKGSPKPTIPRATREVTTLSEIADGRFESAINKEGNGGELVTVRGLRVLLIAQNEDGDYHVVVTDEIFPAMITEITPKHQRRGVTIPAAGTVIDVTGVTYFDPQADGAYHEFTNWELHPVTTWRPSD